MNKFFYQDDAFIKYRVKLVNKVLFINFTKFSISLFFIFSDQQIKILSKYYEKDVDCVININSLNLFNLINKQNLFKIDDNDQILIKGDIQLIYDLLSLFQIIELDLAYFLNPYLGDIYTEKICLIIDQFILLFNKILIKKNIYLYDLLVEVWRIFPDKLETLSFFNKIEILVQDLIKLEQRLVKLENQNETWRN